MTSHRERPAVRWHGGKWKIAKWILEHFPRHDTYVESFGGGASILLRKPRAKAELYNDLDETMVQVFRVLRDPDQAAELIRLLELTPFARGEFEDAYEPCQDDPIEAVRRTLVRSYMGYGSDGTNGVYRTGFRRTITGKKKFPALEWATFPASLRRTVERLQGVVIESTDAFKLIPTMDDAGTLHYIDPPYLPETRSAGNRRRGAGYHVYKHDLETSDHVRLLNLVKDLDGMVVLSGYPSELYADSLTGWHAESRDAYADGGRPRTEMIWLNPAAQAALDAGRRLL
jgi:DNA adenine methylase